MSDVQFQQARQPRLAQGPRTRPTLGRRRRSQDGPDLQHQQGAEQDVIAFERSGVNGTMTVTADSFDVNIKLGLMMKAFKPMIEAEMAKNVSRMVEGLRAPRPEPGIGRGRRAR